jgi:hypothetical protein
VGANASSPAVWTDGSTALSFPFRIPLWDHIYNPDAPLYWAPWAAGPAGVLQQQYVGSPVQPGFEWLNDASNGWQSSSPTVHSWASFGAGEWVILCNAWVSDPISGDVRVGTYKGLDDLELDLAAARAAGTRYVSPLDAADGVGRSRWDDGHAGLWLSGGPGESLVPG